MIIVNGRSCVISPNMFLTDSAQEVPSRESNRVDKISNHSSLGQALAQPSTQLDDDTEHTADSEGALGVQLRGVGRTFGQTDVLADINLNIDPGAFSILIGPSGCGKTTLLRMIGRLDQPTVGDVAYVRRSSETVTPDSSALSYGFQEPRLLPWRTVYQNVALPLQLRGMRDSEIRPIVEDSIERVGLIDAITLKPHELSGGMKMRAAIARSLVTHPKLLLLDEPFGALDEITKNRLDDELINLWKRLDVTIVLVTHSLSEAVYLGQRVHILSAHPGRLSSTLEVQLSERAPEVRMSAEFADYVAQAHQMLSIAESEIGR